MSFKFTIEVHPGSLWRIKDDLAAYYLFDKVHCWEYGDFIAPIEFDDMKEENVLMVVKHEIKDGRHHFWLLGNKMIYEGLHIPVGTWDNVFVPFKKPAE